MIIDAPQRTIIKALSWRLFSLVVTFSVTLLITHSVRFAASISILDNLIKFFGYYFHERFWTHVRWGQIKRKKTKSGYK